MCHPGLGEGILGIGGAIGWFAATVATQYGARVLAIDTSGYAVSGARKRHANVKNLDFQGCDAPTDAEHKSRSARLCVLMCWNVFPMKMSTSC
jgi:protein-L-isoaspartate O-methyltransferase